MWAARIREEDGGHRILEDESDRKNLLNPSFRVLDKSVEKVLKKEIRAIELKKGVEPAEEIEQFGLKRYTMRDFVPFGMPMHIFNAFGLIYPAHILGAYGFYLTLSGTATSPFQNLLFSLFCGYTAGLGVTAGCHRYWTHRTYKCNKGLQIFMMILQTASLQYPVIKWCRDHRIHHKYVDTPADPHSAARGFWFSHMGWVLEPEDPAVLKKEKNIPMDDLENDPILQFQVKYYWPMALIEVFILPVLFIYYFFPQSLFSCICLNYSRLLAQTHFSMLINSAAHAFGDKPFDKGLSSVDNALLAMFAVGEGWHNYHHAFPYDYKASELPVYPFNMTTAFIDFCAWMGWAWDLKTVPKEMIDERAKRSGDGSRHEHSHYYNPSSSHNPKGEVVEIEKAVVEGKVAAWGWGDVDMKVEADRVTSLLNSHKER